MGGVHAEPACRRWGIRGARHERQQRISRERRLHQSREQHAGRRARSWRGGWRAARRCWRRTRRAWRRWSLGTRPIQRRRQVCVRAGHRAHQVPGGQRRGRPASCRGGSSGAGWRDTARGTAACQWRQCELVAGHSHGRWQRRDDQGRAQLPPARRQRQVARLRPRRFRRRGGRCCRPRRPWRARRRCAWWRGAGSADRAPDLRHAGGAAESRQRRRGAAGRRVAVHVRRQCQGAGVHGHVARLHQGRRVPARPGHGQHAHGHERTGQLPRLHVRPRAVTVRVHVRQGQLRQAQRRHRRLSWHREGGYRAAVAHRGRLAARASHSRELPGHVHARGQRARGELRPAEGRAGAGRLARGQGEVRPVALQGRADPAHAAAAGEPGHQSHVPGRRQSCHEEVHAAHDRLVPQRGAERRCQSGTADDRRELRPRTHVGRRRQRCVAGGSGHRRAQAAGEEDQRTGPALDRREVRDVVRRQTLVRLQHRDGQDGRPECGAQERAPRAGNVEHTR